MNCTCAFLTPKPALVCATIFALALSASSQQIPRNPHGPAVVPSYMDLFVRPGDDFYDYANGAWEKNSQIRPDRAYESPSSDIDDQHTQKLKNLIDETVNSREGGSSRIAGLYHSYMDEAAIETAGLKPLQPHLQAIAAIKDKHELARTLGQTLRADVDALNMTNFHTFNL